MSGGTTVRQHERHRSEQRHGRASGVGDLATTSRSLGGFSANVACGFHAGDPSVMLRTLETAAARGVTVGAHVAYRDLAGFGRRYVDATPRRAETDVMYQSPRWRDSRMPSAPPYGT